MDTEFLLDEADSRYYPFLHAADYESRLPKCMATSEYPRPGPRAAIRGIAAAGGRRPYVVLPDTLNAIWTARPGRQVELDLRVVWGRLEESGLGRYAAVLYAGAVGLIVPVPMSHGCDCRTYFVIRTSTDERTMTHSWTRVQALGCTPQCMQMPDASIEQETRALCGAIDQYIQTTVREVYDIHSRATISGEARPEYVYAGWNECLGEKFISPRLRLRAPSAGSDSPGMPYFMTRVPPEMSPESPPRPSDWLLDLVHRVPSQSDQDLSRVHYVPVLRHHQRPYYDPPLVAEVVRALDAWILGVLILQTDAATPIVFLRPSPLALPDCDEIMMAEDAKLALLCVRDRVERWWQKNSPDAMMLDAEPDDATNVREKRKYDCVVLEAVAASPMLDQMDIVAQDDTSAPREDVAAADAPVCMYY